MCIESKDKIHKGLDGLLVDETSISKVMPEINSLTYRGYPVQDLAEKCTFEQVAYLIWYGDLPSDSELELFTKKERSQRFVSPQILETIKNYPATSHPMDTTRTSISHLALSDELTEEQSAEANQEKAIRLLAKIPTLVAADYRARLGQEPITPREDLGFSENFFYMCFGEEADPLFVKAFDVTMILYAEHSFNASTFTARVIASSLSDMHGAVVGAVSSLKGPLHGGANEAVVHMMDEIGSPDIADNWMRTALAEKRKVMGFGHRVYRNGDSRVPTMKSYLEKLVEATGNHDTMQIYSTLESIMVDEKNIYPNLDFPAGPAYALMGFKTEFFTPFFVMSRITGWTAHIMEQLASNRLIRPLSAYTGPAQRQV